jgi:hypothetical protein
LSSSYQRLADGTLVLGPPKTDAGRRKAAIPEVIIPELEQHLATWCSTGRDHLVFPGSHRIALPDRDAPGGVAAGAQGDRDRGPAVPRPLQHRQLAGRIDRR